MSLRGRDVCRHLDAPWPADTAAWWADGAGQLTRPGAATWTEGHGALSVFCVYCQEKHAAPGGHPVTILTLGMPRGPRASHRQSCFSVVKKAAEQQLLAGLLARPQRTPFPEGFPQRLCGLEGSNP